MGWKPVFSIPNFTLRVLTLIFLMAWWCCGVEFFDGNSTALERDVGSLYSLSDISEWLESACRLLKTFCTFALGGLLFGPILLLIALLPMCFFVFRVGNVLEEIRGVPSLSEGVFSQFSFVLNCVTRLITLLCCCNWAAFGICSLSVVDDELRSWWIWGDWCGICCSIIFWWHVEWWMYW